MKQKQDSFSYYYQIHSSRVQLHRLLSSFFRLRAFLTHMGGSRLYGGCCYVPPHANLWDQNVQKKLVDLYYIIQVSICSTELFDLNNIIDLDGKVVDSGKSGVMSKNATNFMEPKKDLAMMNPNRGTWERIEGQ